MGLCVRKLLSQHPAPELTFAHVMERLKHGQNSNLKEYKILQVAKRRKDRLRLSSVSCESEASKIFNKALIRVGKISASLINNRQCN